MSITLASPSGLCLTHTRIALRSSPSLNVELAEMSVLTGVM